MIILRTAIILLAQSYPRENTSNCFKQCISTPLQHLTFMLQKHSVSPLPPFLTSQYCLFESFIQQTDQIHPSSFALTHYHLHSHATCNSLSFILSSYLLLLSLPPYLFFNTISFICVAQIHSNTSGCGACLVPWFPSQSTHPYKKLVLLSPVAIIYQ